MSQIKITHLSFCYEGSYDNIFTDVSFQMDTDWKLGFCGRNGRGKTTFLNLLLGKYEYEGTISANVEFEYFPFVVADGARLCREVVHEIAPDAQAWQIERELSLLSAAVELLDRPYETLSDGERTKLLLAALFLRENAFLLIDEPTNHLDTVGREAVAHYLNAKKGFILVSHDRAFLDSCTDHTLSINKTDIEIVKGGYSVWAEEKRRRDAAERAENARLTGEISRLREAERQTERWSDKVEEGKKAAGDRGYVGHMSAKMMQRSKNSQRQKENAIAEREKLLKDIERDEPLKMRPLEYRQGLLLSLTELSIAYGDTCVCEGLSFQLHRGDRLALRGGNGSGKSSIIKLIVGEQIPHGGTLRVGSGLIISYVPQDSGFLRGSLKAFARENGLEETVFFTMLRKLDLERKEFEKKLEELSEGQRKKVLLAKSCCEYAHLYVWDEPFNYVDIVSREQIEGLIVAYQPTMLFVEHDRAFCDKVATRKIEL